MDELCALPYEGEARNLCKAVCELRPKVDEAIAIMDAHHDDNRFFDQMAYSVVRMETILFIELLLLRDSINDSSRLKLAREFAAEYLPEFTMHYTTVKNQILPDPEILTM